MNTEICLKSIFLDDLSVDCNDFFIQLNGEVNCKSAAVVSAKLYDLDKKGLPFIPLVIHSDGGCVDALHTILSAMDSVVTPIATIVNSKAVSAAAVIFLMGTNGMRYMCPNSFIMCHEASSYNVESVNTNGLVLTNDLYRLANLVESVYMPVVKKYQMKMCL